MKLSRVRYIVRHCTAEEVDRTVASVCNQPCVRLHENAVLALASSFETTCCIICNQGAQSVVRAAQYPVV